MSNSQDTVEGFIRDESKAALELPNHFDGRQLAPYSEGMRLLWLDIYEGKTARFAGFGLIFMLLELQEIFEGLLAKSGASANLETLWMLSSAELLRKLGDREQAQAQVLTWVSKIGRKKSREAMDLAWQFLDEAGATDAKQPPPDESGASAGK